MMSANRSGLFSSPASKPKRSSKQKAEVVDKHYANGNHYTGEWKYGKMHGKGTYVWADGSHYVGEFKEGFMDGFGERVWPTGRHYRGEWKNDRMHGHGELVMPSGETYKGEFRSGVYGGSGKRIFPNGDEYLGEFRGGTMEGHGTFKSHEKWTYVGKWTGGKMAGEGHCTYQTTGIIYVGQWIDSNRHGFGKQHFPDGCTYEGEFKDDRMDGVGTLSWPDGNSYVGEFQDNQMHGEGKMSWIDNTEYNGQWQYDQMHGAGTRVFADGTTLSGFFDENGTVNGLGVKRWVSGCVYMGEFQAGHAYGNGTFTWPDGRQYVGQFDDDMMTGIGVMTFDVEGQGSCTYKGHFEDNAFHGEGEIQFANGNTFTGQFFTNQFHGQGVFAWRDGRRYTGGWHYNLMHGIGVLEFPDGAVYDGEFRAGHYAGHGTRTWSNGDKCAFPAVVAFECTWVVLLQNAAMCFLSNRFCVRLYCKFHLADIGEWHDSQMHGMGTYEWADGTKYIGVFEHNVAVRHGKKIWPDGCTYVGEFKNDVECGKGVYTDGEVRVIGDWEDGDIKESQKTLAVQAGSGRPIFGMHKGDAGMTLRGMFTATGGHTLMAEKMTTEDEAPVTGCAIIMYANGDKYLGMLLDGRRHGEGTYVYSDLTVYKGKWDADRLEGVRHPSSGDATLLFQVRLLPDNTIPEDLMPKAVVQR
eukprot:TRINITY_DN6508_c0_g1_i3.p1 TRINITY_DN6508_c0_g1~~TRINITY_DN6508_c0_g1_i3.p1  ORF type:complete len:690 (+),score=76.49 TRINITY_DN6508_c0_g1_i3:86-2155(+)